MSKWIQIYITLMSTQPCTHRSSGFLLSAYHLNLGQMKILLYFRCFFHFELNSTVFKSTEPLEQTNTIFKDTKCNSSSCSTRSNSSPLLSPIRAHIYYITLCCIIYSLSEANEIYPMFLAHNKEKEEEEEERRSLFIRYKDFSTLPENIYSEYENHLHILTYLESCENEGTSPFKVLYIRT